MSVVLEVSSEVYLLGAATVSFLELREHSSITCGMEMERQIDKWLMELRRTVGEKDSSGSVSSSACEIHISAAPAGFVSLFLR